MQTSQIAIVVIVAISGSAVAMVVYNRRRRSYSRTQSHPATGSRVAFALLSILIFIGLAMGLYLKITEHL